MSARVENLVINPRMLTLMACPRAVDHRAASASGKLGIMKQNDSVVIARAAAYPAKYHQAGRHNRKMCRRLTNQCAADNHLEAKSVMPANITRERHQAGRPTALDDEPTRSPETR